MREGSAVGSASDRLLSAGKPCSNWTFADLREQGERRRIERVHRARSRGSDASNRRYSAGGRGVSGPVWRPVPQRALKTALRRVPYWLAGC